MPKRLVVVWRVTEACDTACGFCAYDVRVRRPRRVADAAEVLRFGALIARWARGREVLISWLGGEPFLWRPLIPVSDALAALGLRLSITSNGRALEDPAVREWAAARFAEITLSIDGPPAIHDVLRNRPGMGASLLETLAELRGRTPLLRVNTVLMSDNAAAYPAFAATLRAAGADEVTFNALGGNDRPEFFREHRLRVDQLPTTGAAPAYLRRLRATATGARIPVADCAPGDDFWFIEADGRLAPCSFTVGDYGVPIAELRSVADLDALPARLAAARARRRAAACDDCPSTQVHAKFG